MTAPAPRDLAALPKVKRKPLTEVEALKRANLNLRHENADLGQKVVAISFALHDALRLIDELEGK